MSMAMAVRLVLGLICGLVLTWLVWDRSERELAERWDEEHLRPRFLPFSGSYYLPTLMLLYPILGAISGGAQKAVQLTLGLLLRVFLEAGIYYVLLLAMMPRLRRWVSARVCAMLWLLPDWLYVFAGRLDRPTDGKMLVLHAPGVLVYVLLAIWAVGAVGVMVWKIGSHLAFRRRILKNAVPVTDRQTLHVWEAELERAWIRKCRWKLVRSEAVTTPLSIGLFNRTTRVVLPMREYTQEELSLILRHEIIHISRGDPEAKFFLTFCTAMCWFNPLMWAAMRKSADDFELSCDESVLLDEPQPVRRQYAELLLQTAGDERGFTTCLSATAGALRYRLKNIMKPEKKRTGAILVGLTLFVLALCSGYVALAYDKGIMRTAQDLPQPLLWPQLQVSEGEKSYTCNQFSLSSERPMIGFCPGAEFGPAKRWPHYHYAELAKQLIDEGYQVVLFGSAKDHEAGNEILAALNTEQQAWCRNLAGETQLDQAVILIAACKAIVTNDSGLMHVAAALNRPLVALYGPSSPDFTPPLSHKARVIRLITGYHKVRKGDAAEGYHQSLIDITPQRVLEELNSLLLQEEA